MLGWALNWASFFMSWYRLPVYTANISINGITDEIEIIRDKWGVPHVLAKNEFDLWFAQGFLHAQERLWQMELNRRVANGRLSELVPEALPLDKMSRTFGFRRLGEQDVKDAPEEELKYMEAYMRGINQFIKSSLFRMPVEYTLARIKEVEEWTLADTCAIARLIGFQMSRGWSSKIANLAVAEALGEDQELMWKLFEGDRFELGGEPVPLHLPKGVIEVNNKVDWTKVEEQNALMPQDQGSNAWAISGKFTGTGKPILASDPHLSVSLPNIWYESHFKCANAGLDVYGVSIPGVPYICIGHNANVSWGITLSYADVTDVYVEKIHPDDDYKYEFKGEWKDMKLHHERINVKGQSEPIVHTVRATHHGPIVDVLKMHKNSNSDTKQALSLAASFFLPSAALPISRFRKMNACKNWSEFISIAKEVDILSLNLVYADIHGDIGYFMTGRIPIRSREGEKYSNFPVEGWSGKYEWSGFIPPDELPHTLNPEQGYIISCNHRIAGKDYPYFLGNCFKVASRAAMVKRYLDQYIKDNGKVTVDDCKRMHMNTVQNQSPGVIKLLDHIAPRQEQAETSLQQLYTEYCASIASSSSSSNNNNNNNNSVALEVVIAAVRLLREWDADMRADSSAAALYSVFVKTLLQNILQERIGPKLTSFILGAGLIPRLSSISEYHSHDEALIQALFYAASEQHQHQDGVDDQQAHKFVQLVGGKRAVLFKSLVESIANLRALCKDKLLRAGWGYSINTAEELLNYQYGMIHTVSFDHAFGAKISGFNRGPYPVGGNMHTINMQGGYPPGYAAKVVPSYRMVVDMNNISEGYSIYPCGQSGHLASPHYDDFTEMWLKGEYHPMLFKETEVRDVQRGTDKTTTITLRPVM